MALNITYLCQECGYKRPKHYRNPTHHPEGAMLCPCGGQFKGQGNVISMRGTRFEPHFCHTIKQWVGSWSDQEKKAKAFRSPQHPEGFVLVQDNKRFLKECKDTVKNREDIIHKTYSDDGINYKRGSNVNWSDEKGCFVNSQTKEPVGSKKYSVKKASLRVSEKVVKAVGVILMLLTISSTADATALRDVEGLRWIPVTVNGVTYQVPEHKDEFFGEQVIMWLKAIEGDQHARTYILGGREKAVLFMGDGDRIIWLYMTKDKVWVEEVK